MFEARKIKCLHCFVWYHVSSWVNCMEKVLSDCFKWKDSWQRSPSVHQHSTLLGAVRFFGQDVSNEDMPCMYSTLQSLSTCSTPVRLMEATPDPHALKW